MIGSLPIVTTTRTLDEDHVMRLISSLSFIVVLTLPIPAILGLDAPNVDPEKDTVEHLLKAMDWIPDSNSNPPVIDLAQYKPTEIPVDPSWSKVEQYWRPGVLRSRGYTRMVAGSGPCRCGHWTDYDQFGRILFDGAYNSNGEQVGVQIDYYSPDRDVIDSSLAPQQGPLPVKQIVDIGKKEIHFYPDGNVKDYAEYKSSPTGQVLSCRSVSYLPHIDQSRLNAQPFDPLAPVVPNRAAPIPTRVSQCYFQEWGDSPTRTQATFYPSGNLKSIEHIPQRSQPVDPNHWRLVWLDDNGLLSGIVCGRVEFACNLSLSGFNIKRHKEVVQLRIPGKLSGGLQSLGFIDSQSGAVDGPWIFWNQNAGMTATGTFTAGKPDGDWIENQFGPVNGTDQLIESDAGKYQDGKKEGEWQCHLFAGSPDVANKEPNPQGYLRIKTFHGGALQSSVDKW